MKTTVNYRFDYKDITLIYDGNPSGNEWSTYKIFRSYGDNRIAIIGTIDLGCLDTVFISFLGCRITIDKEYSICEDKTEIYLCDDDIRNYKDNVYGYSRLNIAELLTDPLDGGKFAKAIYSAITDKAVDSVEGCEIVFKHNEFHAELSYSDQEYKPVELECHQYNNSAIYHVYNDDINLFIGAYADLTRYNNYITLCSVFPLAKDVINIPFPKDRHWWKDYPCLLSILDFVKNM